LNNGKKTILSVEDDRITAIVTKKELEKYNYEVVIADSGDEAVQLLKNNNNISLVLMDIDLGDGMDGIQTASLILNEKEIPIVFLSSHEEPEIVEKTERISSYGYVVKKSRVTVLDASIKMAFKLYEANRQLLKSEVKERTMIANISDVICIIDVNGLIQFMSSNITKFFGWLPDEMPGVDGWILIHPDDLKNAWEEFNLMLENEGSTRTVELKIKCKSGLYKPIEMTGTNLSKNPDIEGILINFRDITDHKIAKEKLYHSEEKFRMIFNNSPLGFFSFNEKGIIVECNDNFIKITGSSRETLIGLYLLNLPDENIVLFVDGALKGKTGLYEGIYQSVTSKKVTPARVFFGPIIGKNLEITGGVGIMEDITERNQSMDALVEIRYRLDSIIESLHVGSWEWHVQTGQTIFNEYWAEIIGYTLEELSPVSIKTWESLTHPEDLKRSFSILEKHFSGELPFYNCECRMKHKDGHWVWIYDRGCVISRDKSGKPLIMYGTHTDISEHKSIEKELEKSQVLMKSSIESAKDIMIFSIDRQYRLLYFNNFFSDTALKSSGIEIQNGIEILCILKNESDRIKLKTNLQRALAGESFIEIDNSEYTDEKYYETRYNPIIDDKHKIVGATVFSTEITERKRMEDALQKSEEYYRTLISSMPSAVCIHDYNGRIISFNNKALDLLYIREDQMNNMPLHSDKWRFIDAYGENIPEGKYPVRLVIESKKPVRNVVGGIIRPYKQNVVWVLVNADPIFDKDGIIKEVIVILSDITEIKNAENEIILLNQRIMILQEEERERVAKDLHDSVGQTILAAKINIDAYRQNPVLFEKYLDKGVDFLDKASQELREIYMDLYPSILNDLGLEMAVRWLADNVMESAGIVSSIKIKLKKRLSHGFEVNLYRIIQELLSNVLKHAKADQFSLSLKSDDENIKLIVKDNGTGFRIKERDAIISGCGISNIKNRVKYMNGNFSIGNNKPQGTKKINLKERK